MSLFGLPTWLLAGLALGALLAVLITAVFLAGERLFPSPTENAGRRQRGEEMRREEIGYYLDAIGEAYDVDATVEGYDVAFLLPERGVAITFDARAFLALRDSDVYAILVEHEMPGVHIGNRLPFDTPDVGPETDGARTDAGRGPAFGDAGNQRWRGERGGHTGGRWASDGNGNGNGDDRESIRTSFAVLGLPPDASGDEVRAAYRARVKEVHPDHGGDERSFKRIQEAYSTAKEHAD